MTESDKIKSTLRGDINRLRKMCVTLTHSNKLRKHQITQFDTLVKVLIKDGRLTKEELSKYMIPREVATKNIK